MANPLPHLQTYARLRHARHDDAAAVASLSAALSPQPDRLVERLPDLLARRTGCLTIAVEGDVVVGAAVLEHEGGGAVATLTWLGVARSARGRGVGQLLLHAVIRQAQLEGAAVVHTRIGRVAPELARLLASADFATTPTRDGELDWALSLWLVQRSTSADAVSLPSVRTQEPEDCAAIVLMVGMAAVNQGIVLSARLQGVLRHEIGDGASAATMALAAMRRGFRVSLYGGESLEDGAPDDWRLTRSAALPSPEHLVGLLSRGHVPLLRLHLERLHGAERPGRWLLLSGFDGQLFRVIDPALGATATRHAITLGELRVALASADEQPAALIVLRPARN